MRIICPADKRIIELTFVAVATRLRHVVTAILLDQCGALETIGYVKLGYVKDPYRLLLKRLKIGKKFRKGFA